jgi:hypothetical protein
MLKDEEFGEDFIKPFKSQGVREITDSVMTIRVKFTAKPGSHFVIRREAYRRITQALQAQGIQYAHRRVIVDLPNIHTGEIDDTQKEQIARAAGAGARAASEDNQSKKGKAETPDGK